MYKVTDPIITKKKKKTKNLQHCPYTAPVYLLNLSLYTLSVYNKLTNLS